MILISWLKSAAQREESWWPDWQAWVSAQSSGELVAARVPGDGALRIIEDAPASYARVRAD